MIRLNYNLKRHNTFALNSIAQYFAQPTNHAEILQALDFANSKNLQIYPLGTGSNILLQENQTGLVLQNSMQQIQVLEDNQDFQLWRVEAGVNWHQLVMQSVEKNLFGLERLALIPSSVGASPVQNIGAYGAEVKQTIQSVEVLTMEGKIKKLSNQECEFDYRSSIFKTQRQYLILAVEFKLHKAPLPFLQDYANLNLNSKTSSSQIADEIIKIRQAKLPDPKQLPNVGSFFKNPIISEADFKKVNGAYPQIPHFSTKAGVKIPAGWLLEQAGFKGKRYGSLSMYEKQALVMVKYADANLDDILKFAQTIKQAIKTKFNINLEIEPQQLLAIFIKDSKTNKE